MPAEHQPTPRPTGQGPVEPAHRASPAAGLPRPIMTRRGVLSTAAHLGVGALLAGCATDGADATVDFAAARDGSELSEVSFGSCISTYSGDGENVNIVKGSAADSAAWRATLGGLGPLVWRIPLAWHGGSPGSSAGGARSYGDAGDYVSAIRSIGGTPVVVVGGTTGDNDILADDAAALVRYFNDDGGRHGGPVDHWIIGNEPDNGGDAAFGMAAYIHGGKGGSGFSTIVGAMRAATSRTLEIAGPSLVSYASWNKDLYDAFLDACGHDVDVVDFHLYEGADLPRYSDAVTGLQQAVASRPHTAGRVGVQLGEYNWMWRYEEPHHGAGQFYTSRNTVAGACTIGRLVEQGGRAYQYSDNNGPLGLITPGGANNGAPASHRLPTPAYYGLKMWTGGDLFRRPTGSMAACTTALPEVELFASTGQKNVVLVNKSLSRAHDVVLAVRGVPASGSYEVWQTVRGMDPSDSAGAQWQDPVRVDSGSYRNGRIAFPSPATTVTTVLIDG
ncbi:hypothetical protein [Kocuria turfanensis]|nr:hypothetical protein [Kocuria turfanensis]